MKNPDYIQINKRRFEPIQNRGRGLEPESGTVGYYKTMPINGIKLFDIHGVEVGGINGHGVLYTTNEHELEDGCTKKTYHPWTPDIVGGAQAPYGETVRESHAALVSCGIQRQFEQGVWYEY